jgi:hypothetical protein
LPSRRRPTCAAGPGGPTLVIADFRDSFSCYYSEILLAEGLNAFHVIDISSLDSSVLASHDAAILGQVPLTLSQSALLEKWVTNGAGLVAMRPDDHVANWLGLRKTGGILGDAYVEVDTTAPPGEGIVGRVIQFHGAADLYELVDGERLATLFSSPTTRADNPAVTLRPVGRGKAAAFAFDLARSVVYTRQGNPAWAGQKRDHDIPPIRPDDLFFGAKTGDLQPDWVNLDNVAIPQADELQHLLANLILHVNRHGRAVPRFSPFPFGEKAVVIMTADNHKNNEGIRSRLERQLAQDPPGCDPTRWQCVRSTVYLNPLHPIAEAARYEALGFEFGVHVQTNCEDWTPASLSGSYASQLRSFRSGPSFEALAAPVTVRTHCVVWSDWATQPKVELQHGIRFDTNYYFWPSEWVRNRPGFFTGSGMPMRFADLDGSTIDVYQAATQVTDESAQTLPFTIDTLLDRALGPEGFYGAIAVNIHCDSEDNRGSDMVVQSALARGVPVISAKQMLAWLDGRNASSFRAIRWRGVELTLEVRVGRGAIGLVAMLPMHDSVGRRLDTLTREGLQVHFDRRVVKGVGYAVFPAEAAHYRALYSETSGHE